MHTTYHFKSVSELNEDILAAIKTAFKGKAISVTIREDIDHDKSDVYDWHMDLVEEEMATLSETELKDWTESKDDFYS